MVTFNTITKRPRLPTREPEVVDFDPIDLDILGDPFLGDLGDNAMQSLTQEELDAGVHLPDLEGPSSFG